MPTTGSGSLRVAVVGLGWVTTNRHIPAIRKTPGMVLVGAIDKNPERVEATASRLRIRGAATADLEQIGWLEAVDAVTIGTPPPTHFELARQFLRLGKHVLVEKPMTATPSEAEALIETASSAGRVLAVVHNFQFARSVTRLRSLLDRGQLGEIRSIMGLQLSNPQRRLPSWYGDLPLGLFTDESPHLLYLARALAGGDLRVDQVGMLLGRGAERTPRLIDMRLSRGDLPVTLSMHFDAPVSEWHLAVLGTRGMAVADIFRDILVLTPNDRAHRATDILRTSVSVVGTHLWGTVTSGVRLASRSLSYGNDEVFARFAAACRDGSAPKGMAGIDGLRVVELQQQVMSGARKLAA